MSVHLQNLIAQGENQQVDFKFEITDSKKLARTIAAFANTDGGVLLIGVKDNGVIAGVRSEEEYYMLDAAANVYCKPPVPFTTNRWEVEGKTVLEVIVAKSETGPHYAPYKDNTAMVYIRVNDQTLLANKILLRVWDKQKHKKGVFIRYGSQEKILFDYLRKHGEISFSQFRKIARISAILAENILVNLISLNIIEILFSEKQTTYRLKAKDNA